MDSDYPLDALPTDFVYPWTVLSSPNLDQPFHLEPLTLEDASLSSFMDQAYMFDFGMDPMPQSIDNLSNIDFSPPMVEMDPHLIYPDSAFFDITVSSNSLLETPFGMSLGDMSLSGSLDLNSTL